MKPRSISILLKEGERTSLRCLRAFNHDLSEDGVKCRKTGQVSTTTQQHNNTTTRAASADGGHVIAQKDSQIIFLGNVLENS